MPVATTGVDNLLCLFAVMTKFYNLVNENKNIRKATRTNVSSALKTS